MACWEFPVLKSPFIIFWNMPGRDDKGTIIAWCIPSTITGGIPDDGLEGEPLLNNVGNPARGLLGGGWSLAFLPSEII